MMELPMLVAGAILVFTFLGVFTEQLHGIERAKFAMAGAGAIVISGQFMGFYSPEEAVLAIDWNVIFLLAIMMVFVSIMISTGGFDRLAHYLARISGGSQLKLLVLLGSSVTVFSLLLDNVTTVIIFAPLIIMICREVKISPIPYLLAAALLSDTGGVATLVGDPPNLMIGSAANIDFNTFIIHMGPPVLLAWLGVLVALKYLFSAELSTQVDHVFSTIGAYRSKRLWYKSLMVLAVMVSLFLVHHRIGWPPWFVAAACLTLLLFMSQRVELEEATKYIETPLLIFFISLFILVGGVEHSGLLAALGEHFRPYILDNPVYAAIALLWVAAILSALIDNIPFTAAMIPILAGLEQNGVNVSVMWWALAMGVGMGGNGSHIGSTANVYIVTVSERLARETGRPELAITPGLWLRKGTPVMLLTLVLCTFYIYVCYDWLYL
jgi:Na+/H+ antiporter NhaD/arsenite permease-like protein